MRVTVQDLQRERDFLRSEMAKNRGKEINQSLLMSTLIRPKRFHAERDSMATDSTLLRDPS